MIYFDIDVCSTIQYTKLLEYIFRTCNKVSFHFPNFENTFENPKEIKLGKNGTVNQEYVEYLNKNHELISLCFQRGGKKYVAHTYMGAKFRYNTQVIDVNLFPKLKEMIKKVHIFEWQYPNLPEDLCFFADNKCRFYSVAHEHEFFICNETKEDLKFLSENHFEYIVKSQKSF